MSFVTKIQLKDKIVYCEELKVKHLKTIYKCLLGEEIDAESLLFNLDNIFKTITEIETKKLSFIDFFIILINLRCSSIGNIINIQISENTNLELNLFKFIEELSKIEIEELLSCSKFNDITIHYKLPTISQIIEINNNPENICNFFIQKIEIKDQSYTIDNLEEADKILKNLPAKNFTTVFKRVQNIVQYFNSVNLLNYNKHIEQQLFFNFNIKNLTTLIKILFGDHLLSLYENLFALCKLGNFTPEYIENCTPGEYILFVKKLQEANKQEQAPQQNSFDEETENLFEEPINPYESGDLPPITSQFSG